MGQTVLAGEVAMIERRALSTERLGLVAVICVVLVFGALLRLWANSGRHRRQRREWRLALVALTLLLLATPGSPVLPLLLGAVSLCGLLFLGRRIGLAVGHAPLPALARRRGATPGGGKRIASLGFIALLLLVLGSSAIPHLALPTRPVSAATHIGTPYSWGSDGFGQLGNGTPAIIQSPIAIYRPGEFDFFTGASAIAAAEYLGGEGHNLALVDRQVLTWGSNRYEELGVAGAPGGITPLIVDGLDDVVAISAWERASAAVRSDGSVWEWGVAGWRQGQVPLQVASLPAATAVAVTERRSLALLTDGTVWTWGSPFSDPPAAIQDLGGIVALNARGDMALSSGGAVYTWVCPGEGGVCHDPAPMAGLGNVKALASGRGHNLALLDDGTVWAWGVNADGQLGTNDKTFRATPVQVSGLSGVTAIAAGSKHSLALTNTGQVWAWGSDFSGQLGNGPDAVASLVPAPIPGLTGVTAISAGGSHSLALTGDQVWSWGANGSGEAGAEATSTCPTEPCELTPAPTLRLPRSAAPFTQVGAITAGTNFSLALKADGTVWGWGDNQYGQLGADPATWRDLPAMIAGLGDIHAIATGTTHSLALKRDGTVWAWGANDTGQIGNGTSGDTVPTPTQVGGLTNVIAIAAGGFVSMAVKADGTVWAWGKGQRGQLGTGGTASSNTPVQVSGLGNISAVAVGYAHSLALGHNGRIWAWGDNSYGQFGTGNTASSLVPVQVEGINGVVTLTAGGYHTLAIRADGALWTWGRNGTGQLGDGTTTDRATPQPVAGLGPALTASGGDWFSLALLRDGRVWGWGRNSFGELGDGTTTSRATPQRINGPLVAITAIAAGRSHALALYDGEPLTPALPYDALHNCALSTPWTMHAGLGTCATFGTFLAQQTDLAIPGRGTGLTLTRTYHSADPTDIGFGPGWSFSFGMSVTAEQGGALLVRAADGRRDRYTNAGGSNFSAPAGIYDILVRNSNGSYTLTTPDQFVHRFDVSGRLQSITDRNNNTTTLNYPGDRLVIEEPAGRKFLLFYGTGADSQHFVRLEERDVLGRTVSYSYDPASGDLKIVTDPRGNPIAMTYDQHRLLTVKNQEAETVVTSTYDGQGRVATQKDGKNNTWTFDYTQTNKTAVDGPRTDLADTTTYEYDAGFRVMRVTDPLGGNLIFARDAGNNPYSVTDRYGGVTARVFDARGNVTQITNATGNVTEIDFSARNDPTHLKDGNNNTTTFDYDNNGNLLHVYRPLGQTTTYAYDPAGNGDLTSETDRDGFTTTYGHDQWGNVNLVNDPTNVALHFTFDAGGRLTARQDALGHQVIYDYSGFGNPRLIVTVQTSPAAGQTLTTTTRHDKAGRVQELVDANDHITRYTYDANSNTTKIVVAQGTINQATTQYAYDEADNIKRWTDADGRQTDYRYDGLDRLLTEITPAPNQTTGNLRTHYTYDDPPRTVQRKDPNGRTTTITHNPIGLVTRIDYPRTDDAQPFAVTFGYDGVGNRTGMVDQIGATSYGYDALNRLITTTTPQPTWGPGRTATVSYAYDQPNPALGGAHNCTILTYPLAPDDPRQRAANSCSDPAGRLKTVTDWNANTTSYDYDGAGRLTGMTYPNHTTTAYGYDNADRLTSVVNTRLINTSKLPLAEPGGEASPTPASPVPSVAPNATATHGTPTAPPGANGVTVRPQPLGTPRIGTPSPPPPAIEPPANDDPPLTAYAAGPFSSQTYTLDNVGNRIFADELTATNQGNGRTRYEYDAQNQLTTANYPATLQAYSYTNAGNRRALIAGTQEYPYTYDEAGRLLRAYDPGRSQNATYTYDNNGNQISKTYPDNRENLTLQYNGANQLVMVKGDQFTGDPEHRFRHSGDGMLVAEKPWIGPWTSYVYDVTQPNPPVLLKIDSDGNKAVFSLYGHGLIARVVTGVDVGGTPKPEKYTYIHHDGLGSVRAVTDEDAHLVAAYDYDAFGGTRNRLIVINRGEENPVLFAGEQFDQDTGHYYLRARRYDPATGRFTQPDPLGVAGGENLYAYAANNPATLADHSGMAPTQGGPTQLELPGLEGTKLIRSVPPSVRLITYKIRSSLTAWSGGRKTGIARAWRQEQELVKKTGQGTRDWTPEEADELLRTGEVQGYTGHHINWVEGYSKWAGDPRNIRFLSNSPSGGDHLYSLQGHRGSWTNSTSGRLIDREAMIRVFGGTP